MRGCEIAREVFEHRRFLRINAVVDEEALIGLRRRLWFQLRRFDVENVLEMFVNGEAPHYGVSMFARPIGKDELTARQLFKGSAELRIGLERRMVDLMHEIEKIVR